MSNKKGEEETKGRALCKQTRNTCVSRHFLNGTQETGDGLKNYTWEQDRNYKEPSWEITYHLLWNSYLLEYFYLKKWWTRPDTVVQTCSPSTRGWGRRTAWAQEFKVTLGNTVFKKKNDDARWSILIGVGGASTVEKRRIFPMVSFYHTFGHFS